VGTDITDVCPTDDASTTSAATGKSAGLVQSSPTRQTLTRP